VTETPEDTRHRRQKVIQVGYFSLRMEKKSGALIKHFWVLRGLHKGLVFIVTESTMGSSIF
jgi:hypothetical protein